MKNVLSRIFKNPYFINISSTTLGVLLAFHLNNLASESALEKDKQKALKILTQELEENQEAVEIEKFQEVFENFLDVERFTKEFPKEKLISAAKLEEAKKAKPKNVTIDPPTKNSDGLLTLNYETKLTIMIHEFHDVAWEAVKASKVFNEFSFECISAVTKPYLLQGHLKTEENKLLSQSRNMGISNLIGTLDTIRQLLEQLKEEQQNSIKALTNCS